MSGNSLDFTAPDTNETYVIDQTGPTPTLSGPTPLAVHQAFTTTIDFGETVQGFSQDDLQVVGGQVTAWIATTNGAVAELTPDADVSTITWELQGAATDAYGNGSSIASDSREVIGDGFLRVTEDGLPITGGWGDVDTDPSTPCRMPWPA